MVLTISETRAVTIPPTPMEARLPASISRSPPVVCGTNKLTATVDWARIIHRNGDLPSVESGGGDEPRDDAGAEPGDGATDAAPLVRRAPGDAHRDGDPRGP